MIALLIRPMHQSTTDAYIIPQYVTETARKELDICPRHVE